MQNIEKTLELYDDIFSQLGFYDVFPELQKQVKRYGDIIKASSTKVIFPANREGMLKQAFKIPIQTGFFEEEYELHWHIFEAYHYKVKPQLYPIDKVEIHCDGKELDTEKLLKCRNGNPADFPIIIANCLPFNKWFVIDGNHRYQVLKERGIKEIEAIVLQPEQHIQYMRCDRMKTLYKINHNLSALLRLARAPLSKFSSEQTLLPNTYYPLPDPINYSLLSTLKLLKYKMIDKYKKQEYPVPELPILRRERR